MQGFSILHSTLPYITLNNFTIDDFVFVTMLLVTNRNLHDITTEAEIRLIFLQACDVTSLTNSDHSMALIVVMADFFVLLWVGGEPIKQPTPKMTISPSWLMPSVPMICLFWWRMFGNREYPREDRAHFSKWGLKVKVDKKCWQKW